MSLTQPLVLLGMMGAGKSTVATVLADNLGATVVSLDARVCELAGKDIPTIFAEDGEAVFRSLESQALAESLQEENCIIDTGGGVVEVAANRQLLTATKSTRCYLATSVAVLATRIEDADDRPMLAGQDVKSRLDSLLRRREGYYQEVANFVVDASGTADEVAASICTQL